MRKWYIKLKLLFLAWREIHACVEVAERTRGNNGFGCTMRDDKDGGYYIDVGFKRLK